MSHYERYKKSRHSSYRQGDYSYSGYAYNEEDNNQQSYSQRDYRTRPKPRSKVMGVCAGLAQQFGWDVTVVRILAVVGLFTFTGPIFLAYIIAGALFY